MYSSYNAHTFGVNPHPPALQHLRHLERELALQQQLEQLQLQLAQQQQRELSLARLCPPAVFPRQNSVPMMVQQLPSRQPFTFFGVHQAPLQPVSFLMEVPKYNELSTLPQILQANAFLQQPTQVFQPGTKYDACVDWGVESVGKNVKPTTVTTTSSNMVTGPTYMVPSLSSSTLADGTANTLKVPNNANGHEHVPTRILEVDTAGKKTTQCQIRKRQRRSCSQQGCEKLAQGRSSLCFAHGGGYRCKETGCSSGARGCTDFCIRHGGGLRCHVKNCKSSARGKNKCCIAHGGGKRCSVKSCIKAAQGATSFCKRHRKAESV